MVANSEEMYSKSVEHAQKLQIMIKQLPPVIPISTPPVIVTGSVSNGTGES